MRANFILLANGAASDKVVDENRKSRPPKVSFDDGFGAKSSEMTRERGGMDGVQKRGTGGRWNIHSAFIVEVSIVKSPISNGGTWEEGCVFRQVLNSAEYKGVGGGR